MRKRKIIAVERPATFYWGDARLAHVVLAANESVYFSTQDRGIDASKTGHRPPMPTTVVDFLHNSDAKR